MQGFNRVGEGNKVLLYFSLVLVLMVFILGMSYIYKSSITGNSITGNVITGNAPKAVKPQCSDGVDNDRDGTCDYNGCFIGTGRNRISLPADVDCSSNQDNSEFCADTLEICDGQDNNCNGQIDEGGVCGIFSYYCDNDLDRFLGMSVAGTCSFYGCIPYGCSRTLGNDCNDNNPSINPGVAEVCNNGIDDNCDGQIDEGCGFGSGNNTGGSGELNPLCGTVKYNGKLNNSVNIVMVPSGFNGDMNLFRQKAEWISSVFNSHEPLSANNSNLNVLYVSQEGGSYCNFNCSGIDRLLCCDVTTALNLSSICTKGPRQTLVVHNSDKYGGAGGSIATTSVNSAAPQVAVHEFGHSIFKLADEYVTPCSTCTPPTRASANCEITSACSLWSSLIGYKGVNCRPNACYSGLYYTSEYTIMYALNYKFEEVNLRHSCCAYGKITGEYPEYCTQFGVSNLNSYCALNASSGGGGVPMSEPIELSFVKQGNSWVLESVTTLNSGAYTETDASRTGRVPGPGNRFTLRLFGDTGKVVNLNVDSQSDVEYFSSTPSESRYVSVPNVAFKTRIDARTFGKPILIEIDGRRVLFPGEGR